MHDMKEDAGDDDNVEDCAKHVSDVGDVGRGEGGNDYVIGDDALTHSQIHTTGL